MDDESSRYLMILKTFALRKVAEEVDNKTPFIGLLARVEAIEKTGNSTIRMMVRVEFGKEDPELFSKFFEVFSRRNRELIGLIVS